MGSGHRIAWSSTPATPPMEDTAEMTREDDSDWTYVTWAPHQPQADFLVNLLRAHGVPAFHRRAGRADVPEFMGTGARDVLVPRRDLETAREILEPQTDDDTAGRL